MEIRSNGPVIQRGFHELTSHRTRLALLIAAVCVAAPAFGQDRYHDHQFERGQPPLRLDHRYHHDHYYPTRGYAFAAVPRDSVRIGFRGGDYYYHAGVWLRPEGGRFIVGAPPFGIIVPVLPPAYATIDVGGAPYYYANGVYYAPAPGQGYAVVQPPPGAEADGDDQAYAEAGATPPSYDPQQGQQPYGPQPYNAPPPNGQPSYGPQQPYAPQAAAQPRAGGSGGEPIVYPRNNQPPQQVEADKTDCFRWATQNSVGSSAPVFQRAFAACMDGRGYSVK